MSSLVLGAGQWFSESLSTLKPRLLSVDDELPSGVFGARLCVFVCSAFLILFYSFQFQAKRCNLSPIFVQLVTVTYYCISTFGSTSYLVLNVEDPDNSTHFQFMLGRYIFWMLTCPMIISNLCVLLNILTPDMLDLGHITLLMVKDIFLMCFGILGAAQSTMGIKAAFVSASFLFAAWLAYDIINLAIARRKYFMAHQYCWNWMIVVIVLFMVSWTVFPVLFVVGPPLLDISSSGADQIGHAVGDLFAKNCFGFVVWYVRFVVLEPYTTRNAMHRSVSPYASNLSSKQIKLGEISDEALRTKRIRRHIGRRSPAVLIVEPRIEMQRLFSLMLNQAGIITEFAFDINMAVHMLKRDHLGTYHVVFVNLSVPTEKRVEIQRFRSHYHRKPYYLPVLGFTFEEDHMVEVLEREERQRTICDGVIRHILDENHIYELVVHWKEAAAHWRDIDMSADIERKLYENVQGIHRSPTVHSDDHSEGSFQVDDNHDESPRYQQSGVMPYGGFGPEDEFAFGNGSPSMTMQQQPGALPGQISDFPSTPRSRGPGFPDDSSARPSGYQRSQSFTSGDFGAEYDMYPRQDRAHMMRRSDSAQSGQYSPQQQLQRSNSMNSYSAQSYNDNAGMGAGPMQNGAMFRNKFL